MLGASFAQIIRDFVKIFRDFALISTDFKEFCPDFYHIKIFGGALAPPAPPTPTPVYQSMYWRNVLVVRCTLF